jgi:hypothetical protein
MGECKRDPVRRGEKRHPVTANGACDSSFWAAEAVRIYVRAKTTTRFVAVAKQAVWPVRPIGHVWFSGGLTGLAPL